MNDDSALTRYQRQIQFYGLAEKGQRKLLASRVLIVGCGATGSALAMLLARAGVGFLRLVDYDVVELGNLHRQMLFYEQDAREQRAKTVAAAARLQAANSTIDIEPVVSTFSRANALTLAGDVDLILDGTDNFETRYLINDVAVKLGIPWIYTGVMASYGMGATIIPAGAAIKTGREPTPCLQCLLGPEPPSGGPTINTAGIIGPIVTFMASISATEALKILTGQGELNRGMFMMDLWENSFEQFGVATAKKDCPLCSAGEYRFLAAQAP
jgi:adenylyltransferase/sulfurtransferase